MIDLDAHKKVMHESRLLAQDRRFVEALRLLDEAVEKAKKGCQGHIVESLSQHAAVISEPLGDLELVARYYQDAVDWNPESALAQYGLADVQDRRGRTDLAKQHAIKAYSLVANSSKMEDRGLVELIAKRWPRLIV